MVLKVITIEKSKRLKKTFRIRNKEKIDYKLKIILNFEQYCNS